MLREFRQAWRNLKAWRDQKPAPGAKANSLDLEVSAAENYMFARACVCEGFVSVRRSGAFTDRTQCRVRTA